MRHLVAVVGIGMLHRGLCGPVNRTRISRDDHGLTVREQPLPVRRTIRVTRSDIEEVRLERRAIRFRRHWNLPAPPVQVWDLSVESRFGTVMLNRGHQRLLEARDTAQAIREQLDPRRNSDRGAIRGH